MLRTLINGALRSRTGTGYARTRPHRGYGGYAGHRGGYGTAGGGGLVTLASRFLRRH